MIENELEQAFENIQRLAEKHTEQKKKFLFVLAPSKNYQAQEKFPAGYRDTTNTDVEYFLELLKKNDIDYIDLREELEKEGICYEDVFYKTDHHWNAQTGFWAYTKILGALHRIGDIGEVDSFYTDPNNYHFKIYEDSFLGSTGKRTGIFFAGVDDFCIITPKYETNISINIPSAQIALSGEFGKVAYNQFAMNKLEEKNYFNDNLYGLYGWNDRALTSWYNENAPENKKLLLLGNSFGNVPYAFMSLYFTSCVELDTRHFQEDFSTFYYEYAPDTVIFLVHLDSVVGSHTSYHFFE